MMRSPVVSATLVWVGPVLVTLAFFLFLRGHNDPGGGFAGGLVLGLVIVLQAMVGGSRIAERLLRVSPEVWLGLGLFIAILSGMPGLLSGHAFLKPFWGTLGDAVKVGTPLVFDIGVMMLVTGVVSHLTLGLLREEKKRSSPETERLTIMETMPEDEL